MGADFRIKMGRHGNAGSPGNGRRPTPPGDAADAHKIGHHEIARLLLQRFVEFTRTIEIFTDLHWRFQLSGQLGITVQIVIDNRLLDPGEALIVNHVTALKGFGEVEPLIEIDHQVHIVPHRSTNGV